MYNSNDLKSTTDAEELFHLLVELPSADREQEANRRVGKDSPIALRALALANAYDQASIASPPATPASSLIAQRQFGPYTTTGLLGRGGMGAVYLVHRVDGNVEHKVAVKIIGLPFDLQPFQEKFRLERQILASLNHPCITHFIDGGVTPEGELYLIMEYVDGTSIDSYARTNNLSESQRLELFLLVAGAVFYAHQNLIVHRDLKPGNILVSNLGTPKLLDFGTAKLLNSEHFDNATSAALLTVAYASPEQLRGEPATTLSDIYSLGIILYELLSGQKAFTAGLVSRLDPDAETKQLTPLHGDLDLIVHKAMAPLPAGRYSSVDQFAEDVRRYQTGKAVLAHPESATYRARKFILRNRLSVAAASVALFSILGGSLATLWQSRLASERYVELRGITRTLLRDLNLTIQDIPGSTGTQKLLVSRLVPVLDKLALQSSAETEIRLDLAEAYRELGDLQGNPYSQNLGDLKGGLATLEKARLISAAALAARPANLPAIQTHALVLRSLGETFYASGSPQQALPHLVASATLREQTIRLRGPGKATAEDFAEAVSAHSALGDLYGQPGASSLRQPENAERHYLQSLAFSAQALQVDPSFKRAQRSQVIGRIKLGDVTLYTKSARSLTYYEQARAASGRYGFETELRIRQSLHRKLGEASYNLGHVTEAEQFHASAIDIAAKLLQLDATDTRAIFDLAAANHALARVYSLTGRPQLAVPLFEKVVVGLEQMRKARPEDLSVLLHLADNRARLAETTWDSGARGRSDSLAAQSMPALDALASTPDASPSALELASLHFWSIRPARFRNPAKAMAFARRYATQAGEEPWSLFVLAAAQEATRDFDGMRKSAAKALPLLEAGPSDLRRHFTRMLTNYRTGPPNPN